MDNTGGAEIQTEGNSPKQMRSRVEEELVQVDRVDRILPPGVVVDFALIDVEKMEVEALIGMVGVIERSPNLVMQLEWSYGSNPRREEKKTLKLLDFLEWKGYRMFRYVPDRSNTCLRGYFREISDRPKLLEILMEDIFLVPSTVKVRENEEDESYK